MLRIVTFSLIVALSGVGPLAQNKNSAPAPRTVQVSQTTSVIKVDGFLDEAAWQTAPTVELNYEWLPGDGIQPPVRTECWVTYDAQALYVAFRAHDPDPTQIRANLMDRDSIQTLAQDDHVTLMVDTFDDQRRAVQFRVNPLGVQADALFSEVGGIEDFSWDIIWDSAGRITESGYNIELAIPFNQLRFPKTTGTQVWGFEAGRSYPRNVRHRISDSYRDRNDNCLLCQFTKLSGFTSLEPGLNIELAPTLTMTRTDTRPDVPNGPLVSGDEDFEPGLSARWGITPNLTLNGTVNPDFSQVEADVAQLDVNERFALFFSEQRPFFLEGIDVFATPFDAVFTRTVVDPKWGAKITGKASKNLIGVFAAEDDVNALVFPANEGSSQTLLNQDVTSGVVRYRRDVGESSTVGLIYAGRDADDYHNRVGGVDGLFRLTSTDDIRFQYIRSDTQYPDDVAATFNQPLGSFSGDALLLDWNHVTRNWVVSFEWEDRDEQFRADSGFMPRVDSKRLLGVVRRNFWGDEDNWWSRIQLRGFGFRTENQAGQLTDETLDFQVNFDGPLQSFASFTVGREKTRFGGVLYEDILGYLFDFEIQPTRRARFTLFARVGDSIDFINNQAAESVRIDPGVELKLGRHFNAKIDHTLRRLDVQGQELFEANLTQARLVYQLNIRTFVRAILQYRNITRDPTLFTAQVNPEDEELFSQLLFSYKVNPQTVFFVGYSDNQVGTDQFELTRASRTFFVKLGYAWTR